MVGRLSSLTVSIVLVLCVVSVCGAQTRRAPTRKPAAKPAPAEPITVRPDVSCPALLGVGVTTKRQFCDVMIGRDPQTGIIIRLPPHVGNLTLTFDLHTRQTYSAQLVRDKRAYSHQTATIGVLTLDGGLLTRAAVDTEFRNASDLFDRVGGGAGPGGVKAVAPVGAEPITVEVPEEITAVSVLGEKLTSVTTDRSSETITSPGRPIASISNVAAEYRPVPPPKPAVKKPVKKAPVKKR